MTSKSSALPGVAILLFLCLGCSDQGGSSTPQAKAPEETGSSNALAKHSEVTREMLIGAWRDTGFSHKQMKLENDGTWTGSIESPSGKQPMSGSWNLQGGKLTVTTTMFGGSKREPPTDSVYEGISIEEGRLVSTSGTVFRRE
jgi:hypothetical protein